MKWHVHGRIRNLSATPVCIGLAVLIALVNGQYQLPVTESLETPWTGRWMPHPPYSEHADIHDHENGIKMGVVTTECDDAKVHIHVLVHVFMTQLDSGWTDFDETGNRKFSLKLSRYVWFQGVSARYLCRQV
jgi:hypothetical protein